MDFQEMMSAATKNAKKANKEMSRIENEVKDEKSERQRQLEAERRLRIEMQRRKAEKLQESQRRKEEERKKTFTIPKKDGGVDQNAVKAYYEKQQREKLEKAKKAEKDKEQLMKLRMQANGGKATKKIGKHFGLDPVELQIRFGGNNEHVETLQKRKVREDEEADFEKEKFQSGVYKALQMKKKAEEKLRNTVKGPHRVSTSKSNSLAGLCSRHKSSRDTFSPPKDGKKGEQEKKEEKPVKKKIQAAPPVDFKSLMAAASSISQGKSVKLDKLEAPRPRPPPPQPMISKKPDKPVKVPMKVEKKPEKKPAEVVKRKKAPTPEPPAANLPPFNPNKKYLPGDIRYKMQLQHLGAGGGSSSSASSAQQSNNSNAMPSSSSSSSHSSSNLSKDRREIERQREKERERIKKLKRERQEREDREMERDAKIRKIAHKSSGSRREAELREQQMREKYKSNKKSSSFCRGADDYSDDDDQEEDRSDEEYDSDLDDFIDDTECDMDGLSRKELEETLRMVNRKYDKKKWSQREKQISEREMHSDYRRVQSEENFSKRAGFMEDLREATKGRSVKL